MKIALFLRPRTHPPFSPERSIGGDSRSRKLTSVKCQRKAKRLLARPVSGLERRSRARGGHLERKGERGRQRQQRAERSAEKGVRRAGSREKTAAARREQSGSRRSVIYHAPRGSPIVSTRLLAPSLVRCRRCRLALRTLHRPTLVPLSIAGARRAYIPRRSGCPRAHCDDQEGLVTSVPVSLFLRSRALPLPQSSSSLSFSLSLSRCLLFPLRTLAIFRSLSLPFSLLVARSSFSYIPRRDQVLSPLAPSTYVYSMYVHSGYMRAYM